MHKGIHKTNSFNLNHLLVQINSFHKNSLMRNECKVCQSGHSTSKYCSSSLPKTHFSVIKISHQSQHCHLICTTMKRKILKHFFIVIILLIYAKFQSIPLRFVIFVPAFTGELLVKYSFHKSFGFFYTLAFHPYFLVLHDSEAVRQMPNHMSARSLWLRHGQRGARRLFSCS